MKLLRYLGLAALLALAVPVPGFAASGAAGGSAMMCQADVAGGVQGPRVIGSNGSSYANTGSAGATPSGNIYALNGQGCAVIKQPDIGWALSLGMTYAGDGGVIVWQAPVAATGTTSYQIGTLPAGAYIKGIFVQDSDTTHAVTGGITCGVSSGDTTIMSTAQTVGLTTNSVGSVTDAHILLRNFSPSASQQIWCQSATSWNTPTYVTITIPYGFF